MMNDKDLPKVHIEAKASEELEEWLKGFTIGIDGASDSDQTAVTEGDIEKLTKEKIRARFYDSR